MSRDKHRVTMQDDNFEYMSRSESAMEMKKQLGWKGAEYRVDADVQSDKQRITVDVEGITKTVSYNVVRIGEGRKGKGGTESPIRPRDMI
ncbi:hypothetical protein K469DRAFT_707569 [Zopfia rhizophila CBS 207.26]|uniref:Uncharacterized protein n=1 Tax=Zopfia rhizophila CBS 207.26 TaxID=1314779 RepID=A0A6A6E5P0_9PEZI|nr:hypothetical protein K469DRAFT_707569 [Zopfia rhizophila CBS 207.26]